MRRFNKPVIAILLILILLVGSTVFIRNARNNSEQQSSQQKPPSTTKSVNSTHASSTTSFDKSKYSTSDPASIWVVINKQHPLMPKTYAPNDLVAVGNGQYLRREAATALSTMLNAAKTSGMIISPASAYRSYDIQVAVYNREVATYGQATADSQSARPGYSEHQTGLAVDLAGGGCSIEDCFGTTAEGKWAAANSYKYGYILRYTPDDTVVTGYRAESWHFRYVGIDLATKMHAQRVATLEQFFGIVGGADYR